MGNAASQSFKLQVSVISFEMTYGSGDVPISFLQSNQEGGLLELYSEMILSGIA